MTSSGFLTGLKGESEMGEYVGSISRRGEFCTYSVLLTGLKDAFEMGESVRSIRTDECTSGSASGFASGVTRDKYTGLGGGLGIGLPGGDERGVRSLTSGNSEIGSACG